MTWKTFKAAVLCLVFCCAAAPASAQNKWTDKGFVNVNFGSQSGSDELATAFNFPLYREEARVTTAQTVESGPYFEIGGGARVWKNLALGIAFSRVTSDSDVTFKGSIPDPLVFDRPRDVTTTVSGAEHSQTAVHLDATWMMPITDKIDVALSFGPTFFSVKQDLPTGLTISEPGPTVASTTIAQQDKSVVGANFAIDVTYLVTKRLGVGGIMRFSSASAELPGTTDKLSLGGFVIGAGARVRF